MELDFENPQNLAVEDISLKVSNGGIIQSIKALDKYWVSGRKFVHYEAPPSSLDTTQGAVQMWKDRMFWYNEDLKYLLTLEHHKFWSYIIYQPDCMSMLVSFLQEATPRYMPMHNDRSVTELYSQIYRRVMVVFCRLGTHEESESRKMKKVFFKNIIYNKFLFTIPIIFDLCLAYGGSSDSSSKIREIIATVFELQPKYINDLKTAIEFTKQSFSYIMVQLDFTYGYGDDPPNLPEAVNGFRDFRMRDNKPQERLTFDTFRDLVLHLLDSLFTLRIFIESYPSSISLVSSLNLHLSLLQIYEDSVPAMYKKLEELGDETKLAFTEVWTLIGYARCEVITIFHVMVSTHINGVLEGRGQLEDHIMQYFSLMDSMSEGLLIKDYHAHHPVDIDIDILTQAYPQIDNVKTDFILHAVYNNIVIDDNTIDNYQSSGDNNIITNGTERIENHNSDYIPTPSNFEVIPDEVRRESLLTEVRDIFPDLGDGFILKCLEHYNFSSEIVISCLLEDNLDENLKTLDRYLPIIPPDPIDEQFLATGIDRLNVFDGDEFDIMTRDDVDQSKIHKGKKKSEFKDLKDMLDDKTHVKALSEVYKKYSMVTDETDLYSDEYDDTYDEDGCAGAAHVPLEEDARRPFVKPRVLACRDRVSSEESEDDGVNLGPGEDPVASGSRGPDVGGFRPFCENPEEYRARREAAWRRGAAGRRGHAATLPPSRDVVGRGRGQGQEAEVLRNRANKEAHKSSRGNHGRRRGATHKRNQGMIPS